MGVLMKRTLHVLGSLIPVIFGFLFWLGLLISKMNEPSPQDPVPTWNFIGGLSGICAIISGFVFLHSELKHQVNISPYFWISILIGVSPLPLYSILYFFSVYIVFNKVTYL